MYKCDCKGAFWHEITRTADAAVHPRQEGCKWELTARTHPPTGWTRQYARHMTWLWLKIITCLCQSRMAGSKGQTFRTWNGDVYCQATFTRSVSCSVLLLPVLHAGWLGTITVYSDDKLHEQIGLDVLEIKNWFTCRANPISEYDSWNVLRGLY